MPITIPEPIEERGKKDARRHREKQKEALKERIPEIIAEEDIITGKRDRIVKIRIRSLDIPHFRHDQSEEPTVGVGQGGGEPGDIIGERPNPDGPYSAGSEPGVGYIETEVDIQEVIGWMLEDLGLPNLQTKNIKEFLVSLGMEISGRSTVGPRPLLDNRATAKEGIRRFWHFLRYLEKETSLAELVCYDALKKAQGILTDALEALKDPNFQATSTEIEPFAIIYHDDQRYHRIEEAKTPESRAVVIAMMDVSGSMDTTKKYLARSMLFWLVEFLRHVYQRLEIRFILHTAEARIVDEHEFFHTGESGGTRSYAAYRLAGKLLDDEYPASEWNTYLFHFSDGEDEDPKETLQELRKLFERKINMFGYGEVNTEPLNDRRLLRIFSAELPVAAIPDQKNFIAVGQNNCPFLGMRIAEKGHILPVIREFLKKERWQPYE